MIKKGLALFASLSLFASTAVASPLLSYNTADLGFKWTHFDDSELDNANGLEARVSHSPVENFFLEGGYNYYNTEFSNFDIDNHTFRYGGGAYLPFGCDDNFHLVLGVGGLHTDLNGDFDAAYSDDGVYTGPSLRAKVSSEVELGIGSEFQDYDDAGNGWIHNVNAIWAANDNLAIVAKAELTDESDVGVLGGVRYAY